MKTVLKSTLALAVLFAWATVYSAPDEEQSVTTVITVCPSGCAHITIQAAVNASKSGDTIQIFMTSPLTEGDIIINKNLTLEGLDQAQTIVQANAAAGTANARVVTILPGHNVTMRDLTIRHGRTTTGDGGGIWVQAGSQLTMESVGVRDNQAVNGGGIANEGKLTISLGTVQGNAASHDGGGIFNTGSTSTLYGTVIVENTAGTGSGIFTSGTSVSLRNVTLAFNEGGPGGGLRAVGGTVEGERLYIVENDAHAACGGGIMLENGVILTLRDSAINSNGASNGGGICQVSSGTGAAYLTNVTIFKNRTNESGGGIFGSSGVMTLANVTVTGNIANLGNQLGEYGGGIYIANSDIHIKSALVAGNGVGAGSTHPDCYGSFRSASFSLIGNRGPAANRCGWAGYSSGMLQGVSARFGAVELAGFATVIQLLSDSPAIDSGVCIAATGPAPIFDQRGYIMPWDGDGNGSALCDMGAYEYGSIPAYRSLLPVMLK